MIRAAGLSKDVRRPRGRLGRSGPVVRAVEAVDLELDAGEIVGIVGPTGSGRTTLGLLLTGRLTPDAGTLHVAGTDIHSLTRDERRAQRDQLQLVGDAGDELPGRRTLVADVLGAAIEAGAARGSGEGEFDPAELLALVGLEPDVLAARVGALTPRQRRLVAAARVVARRPSLVVLDDPVGAGEDDDSVRIREVMLRLRREQRTAVVVVASSLEDVLDLCDRILVMYLGAVMEVLEPSDIPAAALHPFTHALISAADAGAYSTRVVLKGDAPDPVERPTGCVLHPRCFRAQERCVSESPQLAQPLGATHLVACHFPEIPVRGSLPQEIEPVPDVGEPALGSVEPTAREFAEE